MNNIQIAAAIMVKNEEKRIETTLNSIKKDVDGIVLFDTGSTDNTIDIVKKYVEINNLKLHLLEGVFEDFSTSRNEMLEFAETFSYDYMLLLDCNDELKFNNVSDSSVKTIQKKKSRYQQNQNQNQNHQSLKKLLDHKKDIDGFMVHQKWHIGPNYDLDYFNIKIIKTKLGFRYKGSVHEYIVTPEGLTIDKLEGIVIYQDRVADNDGKTFNRWENDLVLLKKDLEINPNDSRSQFYLAQTYDGLCKKDEAFEAYKLRYENIEGFYEERFLAALNCGRLINDDEEKIKWYLRSFEIIERSEPLVEIAKIYRIKNQFLLAYTFARTACDLEFPTNCTLNVDKKSYDHDRWHELSISCYYIKKYKMGKEACQKAIDSGYDNNLNLHNMNFYLNLKH